MTQFVQELRQILAQPTCIVGVGNLLRNDDAVGTLIAERLMPEMAAIGRHTVIAAEDVIENYCFSIADSAVRNVLVIDAVQGAGPGDGAGPGSLVLGRLEELEATSAGYSTHKLALSTAASVLRHHGKDVWLLGIVAANTDYGTTVSQDVLTTADAVVDLIGRTARGSIPHPRDAAPAVSRQWRAPGAPSSAAGIMSKADQAGAHSKEF